MAPPRCPEPSPDGLAAALRAFADRLDQPPGDAPDAVVEQTVLAGLALSDRLEAAITEWSGVFDARTIWAGAGLKSPASWVASRTERSRPHASAMFHRARELQRCPHIAGAYRSGAIGTEKVRILLGARPVHPTLFAEHEADLVAIVEPLTVAHARIAVARWIALAQATRAEETGTDGPERDPAEANTCHIAATLGGRVVGNFDLDPVAGAELSTAIDGYIDACFRNGTYGTEDTRTLAQRRAEALVTLVRRGSDPNATRGGEPRPSVVITLDADTLANEPVDDLADGLDRRCETKSGAPIPRSAADRLLCNARITAIAERLLADGTIEVVGVTDLDRYPNARQRHALAQRDGGCTFPGCDAPIDWCDAHHLQPYEVGGPTLLENLTLLCKHHHHLVHEGGWRLWRASDGNLYLQDPHGANVAVHRRGHLQGTQPPPVPPEPPPPYPRRPGFRRTGADASPRATPSPRGRQGP